MCLAIYKPATTAPAWGYYENGMTGNPDGWGFAAVVDGQLEIRSGLGGFSDFRTAFEPFAERQAIIHFRWATHGKVDAGNCHPFCVSDDLAFIHNGILSIRCNVDDTRSDTWHMNELVFRPMHSDDRSFFLKQHVRYVHELAHRGNKFVFLRADGQFAIWNRDDGDTEADGHWFSNDGYLQPRTAAFTCWRNSDSHSGAYVPATPSRESHNPPVDSSDDAEGWLWGGDAIDLDSTRIRDPYGEPQDMASRVASASLHTADEEEDSLREKYEQGLWEAGMGISSIREVWDVFGIDGLEALYEQTK